MKTAMCNSSCSHQGKPTRAQAPVGGALVLCPALAEQTFTNPILSSAELLQFHTNIDD